MQEVESLDGFSHIMERLKSTEEFYHVFFEAEVARGYRRQGYEVKFVKPLQIPTPDLEVSKNGQVFWVECKCREVRTKLDRSNEAIFRVLAQQVFNYLQKVNKNYFIAIAVNEDINSGDIKYLKNEVIKCVEGGEAGSIDLKNNECKFILAPSTDKRFFILAKKFGEPDQEVDLEPYLWAIQQEFEYKHRHFESRQASLTKTVFRNAKIVCFRALKYTDRISVLINNFKAAAKQLPRKGPGIIWIRLPDLIHPIDFERLKSEIDAVFKDELAGERNRRVNSVHIASRIYEKLGPDEYGGQIYRPVMFEYKHSNPYQQIRT